MRLFIDIISNAYRTPDLYNNEHFQNSSFFLCPLTPGKIMYSDYHSIYRWLQPWGNAKALRVGLQWYPQQVTLRTCHWIRHFLFFFGVLWCFLMYLMKSSVGTRGNDTIIIRTGNLHPSVTSGKNLRSIGRQMLSQRLLIFVRSKNILRWKLDRGCHFGNNWPIYIFNFIFLNTFIFWLAAMRWATIETSFVLPFHKIYTPRS